MKQASIHIILLLAICLLNFDMGAQCTNYNIVVSAGAWPAEVSWNVVNDANTIVASGFAPANVSVCLPDGCYTINMIDSFGDGWNGSAITITDPSSAVIISATFTNGFSSSQIVSFGGLNCCPAGTLQYNIQVTAGAFPGEISWDLVNSGGIIVASGGAPFNQSVCLEPDCYSMLMYDFWGDGWDGAQWTISGPSESFTGTLPDGDYGLIDLSVQGFSCTPTCVLGEVAYHIVVGNDLFPSEVGWAFYDENGFPLATGGSPASVYVCVHQGCYEFEMNDNFGDGWSGASYTIYDENNLPIASGDLNNGFISTNVIEVMGADCGIINPATASDCMTSVDVCENLNFQIDPNGVGLIDEIPASGSFGNPLYYVDGANSPWGTDNYGCLQNGELNSTWMVLNIWQGGSLTFTFGGLGTQSGFYDWIMYPYDPDNTCQDIYNNVLAPVRCNWNLSSIGGTGLASAIPAGGNAGNFEPPLNVNTGDQFIICFSNWSSATTTVPLDFGGSAVVGCFALALPVELLNFEALSHSGFVALNWSTATEKDNDHFRIEHSIDAENWKEIGRVAGSGSSDSKKDYEFIHHQPDAGHNYYRLVQVDFNGNIFTSPVRSVDYDAQPWLVFPNPNEGRFFVPQNCGFNIRDVSGKEIKSYTVVQTDIYSEVKLENVVPGIYLFSSECAANPVRILVK